MTDLFRFIGANGSLGYVRGEIYMLTLFGSGTREVQILYPAPCPYDSWALFFENWERV